jgi:hypothetical protein
MEFVTTIVGFGLFLMSELLPLLKIQGNGLIHSLFLGFGNAFTNLPKDLEAAQTAISNNPDFTNIVNFISENPQMKSLVKSLIKDPQLLSIIQNGGLTTIKSLIKDPQLASNIHSSGLTTSQLNMITGNAQVKGVVDMLVTNPQFCNNVSMMLNNPDLVNKIVMVSNNQQLSNNLPVLLNNPNLMTNLQVFTDNPNLSACLPFINPQISSNIQQLVRNPQMSSLVTNLQGPNANAVMNIIEILNNNPQLVGTVGQLVTQAISASPPSTDLTNTSAIEVS